MCLRSTHRALYKAVLCYIILHPRSKPDRLEKQESERFMMRRILGVPVHGPASEIPVPLRGSDDDFRRRCEAEFHCPGPSFTQRSVAQWINNDNKLENNSTTSIAPLK